MQDKYGFLIEVASRQIKQALQRKLQVAGLDITVDQWVVMDKLWQNPMSQIQVAEAVYKDAPTVTRIIDLLCQKGFAKRAMDPTDRRRFVVTLTEAGNTLYLKIRPIVADFRNTGWQGLSQADYQHLHRIMSSIMLNFNIESAGSLSDSTSLAESKAA